VRWIATVRQPTGPRLRSLADDGAAAILLMAEITPDTLVHAVRSAVRDRTTMSHLVLMRLLEHAARYSAEGGAALTTREQHVLRLLADGEETRSIATELHYSERTVKNVVHDVLTKLNCRTRAQAVGVAMRRGIL
jgi:DNA-binding NarL/FixJ family response regulator